MTWKDGEMMMAFLRTGVILLLALMVAAIPASVPADGIEILTHGLENTNGGQGATNQTPANPKDITAAPILNGKHVKPAVPASVNKVGRMVPAVAVNLSIDAAIPNVDIEEFYIQTGQDPHFFGQAKVLTTLVNYSYYNLMLA
jgi:hypothetical protein